MVDLERGNVDLAVRFVPAAQGVGPVLLEEEVQPMCAPQLLKDRVADRLVTEARQAGSLKGAQATRSPGSR